MSHIELRKNGPNSIESRNIRNGSFSHNTGNQFKILPFKTNPSGEIYKDDFKSFQGIVGEIFRIINNKSQFENPDAKTTYKTVLRQTILERAIEKVDTENPEELKQILSNLFFDDQHGLVKFNSKTLRYMNNVSTNNAIREVSVFIFDLFINGEAVGHHHRDSLNDENLLHQLMLECLPGLPELKSKEVPSSYNNLFPQIKEQFLADLSFLEQSSEFYLKHIESLFKYYYYYYLSQLVVRLERFGLDSGDVVPLFYTLDWETLSETRINSHPTSWKNLNSYSEYLFAHANALELLNYILVDGETVGDYNDIVNLYENLDSEEKGIFLDTVEEILALYKTAITLKTGNWEECERKFDLELGRKNYSGISHQLYKLWFFIKYQFENTERKGADAKYAKWFIEFAKINFTKTRGRLGSTLSISQEFLLFMTRICIGNEEKIRLKSLWERLKERGIIFDEPSKLAITKLFEKINLLEKKSDSGDAQYVKSTI